MNEAMMQLGVGGIFSIFVIREVFNFVKTRKEGAAPNAGRCNLGFEQRANLESMNFTMQRQLEVLQEIARDLREHRRETIHDKG